ncbi:hypothetical protein VTN77DRAFT_6168 [Rasamsonia byssochlamydoides]|uniref:uncharacterized protein n=1 Tax=Rasamsonia byssochlamydoides TaxID=89139 RepID=UPI00374344E1
MAPPKLAYGLNLPNKKPQPNGPPSLSKPNLAAGQKRKKTIFDDSDSEDERGERRGGDENGDGAAVEITTLGGLDDPASRQPSPPASQKSKESSREPTKPPPGKLGIKPPKNSIFADEEDDDGNQDASDNTTAKKERFTGSNKDYTNLAALHSSRKHAKEAEEIDPSIYSYDAVYDSIKAKRDKPAGNAAGENGGGSRYMDALLRSAEIRKRDHLRARDRKLQREREAEGDEYADKEKFVTAAYKAQQEEIRRMEEEEARQEKEEEERRKRNGGTGMVGFYRDMLARDEAQHGEAMKAAQEAARKAQAGEVDENAAAAEGQTEKTEAQIAAELNARGANIILNDEGQVVDKRQLLSAGLNVKPKPKPAAPTTTAAAGAASSARPGARPPTDATSFARKAQRARQTELIAAQLEERARQEEEAEAARQRELAERTRSRKTEADVASARERYLARKREREAQAQAQAKGGG